MSDVVKNYRGIISQINKLHKEYSQTSKNPKLIAVSKTFPEETSEIIYNHTNSFRNHI